MKDDKTQTIVNTVEVSEEQQETRDKKIRNQNKLRKIRESLLLSKAELARKAGLSALTIDRVESGYSCRMDTKRKIILALGLGLADKDQVFEQEGDQEEEDER